MPPFPYKTLGASLLCPLVGRRKSLPWTFVALQWIGLFPFPSCELKTGKCLKVRLSPTAEASGTCSDFERKNNFTLTIKDLSLPFSSEKQVLTVSDSSCDLKKPVYRAANQGVPLDPSAPSRRCPSQVKGPHQDDHKPSQFQSGNSSLKCWCWLYKVTSSLNMLTHSILQNPFISLFHPCITLNSTCFVGCEWMAVAVKGSMCALGNSGSFSDGD